VQQKRERAKYISVSVNKFKTILSHAIQTFYIVYVAHLRYWISRKDALGVKTFKCYWKLWRQVMAFYVDFGITGVTIPPRGALHPGIIYFASFSEQLKFVHQTNTFL
jgi:hypothetical protein